MGVNVMSGYMEQIIDRYLVAGLDERERGFSRLTEMKQSEGTYRAILRYETTVVETPGSPTPEAALNDLIESLRVRGYSQLKSRLDFRGELYLGSQEPWKEYPDPERPGEDPYRAAPEQLARRTGWIRRVLQLFGERARSTHR